MEDVVDQLQWKKSLTSCIEVVELSRWPAAMEEVVEQKTSRWPAEMENVVHQLLEEVV